MKHPLHIILPEIRSVVTWYFATIYARLEGPRVLPFYCDPDCVGAFAVAPDQLTALKKPEGRERVPDRVV